jgi:hypothetical protein
MTEEEKRRRRKERNQERLANKEAQKDYFAGVRKTNENKSAEYQKRYNEKYEELKKFFSNRNGFFGKVPPFNPQYNKPFQPQPKPPQPQPQKDYIKEMKEYQEELIKNKDLIDSDQFRCVEPYSKGETSDMKKRLNSCKQSGNYKMGYSNFFNNRQQCIEYCNK